MDEITPDMEAAVRKAEKLFRLGEKNPNEVEAAAAIAKAQAILTAWNLDMSAIENAKDGKRTDENFHATDEQWEKDLWRDVAVLNFCLYWHQTTFVKTPLGREERYRHGKLERGIFRRTHRVVGRLVNVRHTEAMASYLVQTVKRLTRERCIVGRIRQNTRWAASYREGLADRVCIKLGEARRELLNEEAKRREDERAKAAAAMTEGVSTSHALTISSYTNEEYAKNFDFVYGEGKFAEAMEKRAARAKAEKEAQELHTKWAESHPKEAARERAKAEKEADRLSRRYARQNRYKGDSGAYTEGYNDGGSVSLYRQAETVKPKGFLK